MNRALCHCSPAYGALMHALPRDASALKRMTEMQMFNQAAPWVDRVPHATEHQLDTWTVKAVNPNATNLGDLGDLAELEGIKKKLKKVAKKIAAPVVKVAKSQVKLVKKAVKVQAKVVKKAAKSKIIKKIARPLAFAGAAFLGPAALSAVAKADKVRTAARKVRAKIKSQKETLKAQFAIAEEKLGIEPAQEQAATVEPVEQQAAPEPMVYNEPEAQAAPEPMQASFAPVQQSFATIQQAAPRPQRQAPVQVQRQQAAPEPMVYDEPEPQYQAPKQSFAPSPFYPQSNPVTRLPTADEETEDQPRVVGISATGIMDNIKANPLPWMAGAAVAAYLVTNRKTSHRK